MAQRPAFGRRGAAQTSRPVRAASASQSERFAPAVEPVHTASAVAVDAAALQPGEAAASVEHELAEWKRTRQRLPIPWRPLSFMASICFGLASFVLPAAINDVVQWPLYGLAAVSFYVGVKAKRQKRQTV